MIFYFVDIAGIINHSLFMPSFHNHMLGFTKG